METNQLNNRFVYVIVINQFILQNFNLDYRHGAVMGVLKNIFTSTNEQIVKHRITCPKTNYHFSWISWTIIRDNLISFSNFSSYNSIHSSIKKLIELGFIIKKIIRVNKKDRTYYAPGPNWDDFFYKNPDLPPSTLDNASTSNHPPTDPGGELPHNNFNMLTKKKDHSLSGVNPQDGGWSYPTVEEVRTYSEQSNLPDEVNKFVAYYNKRGWKKKGGKSILGDWRESYRKWCRRNEKWEQEQEQKRSKMDKIQSKMW